MNRRLRGTLLLRCCRAGAVAQHAADAYYDPDAMAQARERLYASHGAMPVGMVFGERLELQSNESDPLTLWEGQGWYGGDIHRGWIKTEGEYLKDAGRFEELELQALYSRAVAAFWNLQVGVRHDFRPDPTRSYLVAGLQGVAPYWFELDGALFLSDQGDLSARLEAEYELRLTQRLMLQPRLEANAAASQDRALGVGRGLATLEAGLRLRYEIRREFAPYLGVSWRRAFGDTAELCSGSDSTGSLVAGLRVWF